MLADIKGLIDRIDSSIPLLQLAISASGESLSTQLPDSVSPSRMLQASAFLMIADTQFKTNPRKTVQVGPEFLVSVYMIFKGYSCTHNEDHPNQSNFKNAGETELRQPVWQEVLHKARLRLHRMPSQEIRKRELDPSVHAVGYLYAFEIIEDKDDGRLHDDTEDSQRANGTDLIPVSQISKLFYTNSAAILNIKSDMGANNTPILLIKRELDRSDSLAASKTSDEATQRHTEGQLFEQTSRDTQRDCSDAGVSVQQRHSNFPSYLDPEWIALAMYAADESNGSQDDDSEPDSLESDYAADVDSSDLHTVNDNFVGQLQSLSLNYASTDSHQSASIDDISTPQVTAASVGEFAPSDPFHSVTTSLSLLELLIRLAVLQETQQQSHLSIPDHIITCFLSGGLRSYAVNEK